MALLSAFVREGVRDVVVAPGSRSQALALAAAELERVGAIRLHVRIDERGAAFLALGTAIESGRPAVVVTTSGTAVANLHPAVLEAHHSGVPLIICSADRPAELRGIRSNQTTMQPGIFAGAVRLERDVAAPEGAAGEADAAARLAREAVDAALGRDDAGDSVPHPGPGPVHLNLQFREPLSAVLTLDAAPARRPSRHAARREARRPQPRRRRRPPRSSSRAPARSSSPAPAPGPGAEEFAREGGWPLVAEVTSGAHFGPNLVVAYRELLREPGFGDAVERVIVFGHPTLSREVPALVQREGVESIVVAPTGIEWYNPGRRVRRLRARGARRRARAVGRRARVDGPLGAGEPHDRRRGAARGGIRSQRRRRDRARVGLRGAARVHARAARRRARARDAPHARRRGLGRDLAARPARVRRLPAHPRRRPRRARPPHPRARQPRPRGHRRHGRDVARHRDREPVARRRASAAGTAAAPDAASPAVPARTGVTRALIGDLTLLHDVGSLLLGAGEPRPRLQVIVGNDGGGTIFDALEVAASASPDAFDRVQFTPQQVDLAALAAAYGWGYARATTRGELDEALTGRIDGPQLVEVPLPR